jgi:hypothetical protein
LLLRDGTPTAWRTIGSSGARQRAIAALHGPTPDVSINRPRITRAADRSAAASLTLACALAIAAPAVRAAKPLPSASAAQTKPIAKALVPVSRATVATKPAAAPVRSAPVKAQGSAKAAVSASTAAVVSTPAATTTLAALGPTTRPGADVPALTDLPSWCRAILAVHSAVREERCLRSGLQPGDGRSVRGTPLWVTDVAPQPGAGEALRVFVLGAMHGDELSSVSVVFDWIDRARSGASPRVHWRFAPLVNPDGFLRSPPTRVNMRGVDLNRNFATEDWNARAQEYWVERTKRDPRRYPGPGALSEPESQWVHRQIAAFKPDLVVSVHAPYGVLDFDGPPPPPARLGKLFLDQVGIYPGSLGNYGGIVLGVPVVTVELKTVTAIPTVESASMWTDLQGWIDRRLLRVAQSGSGAAPKPGQPR